MNNLNYFLISLLLIEFSIFTVVGFYFLLSPSLSEHEEGIVSMAASVNSSQLLTMGGDELLCLWHWNESAPHSNSNKAGFQTARSQLDAFNLIR
jgi:hypothetical protein